MKALYKQNYGIPFRTPGSARSCGCQAGFTLVEMVVVILVLAIISAFAMSRILSGNAFNAIILRDQIVSLARTAQQNSMGRSNVNLTITPGVGGDDVTLTTSDDGGTIKTVTLPLGAVSLSGDINDTDSCETTAGANAISNGAPMTLAFGELGNLGISGVTGSTGAISSAIRICLNNTASESVCVSPSGFAYAGDCDV